ncbi:hypothetical protein CON37_26845 [Bacillus cereus]|nr:hypothetical protein CON37_26845 [Bacillus cereus]
MKYLGERKRELNKQNLFKSFSEINDPRTGNRKVHKLIDIITFFIIATICGANN